MNFCAPSRATGYPLARLDEVRRWAWDYAETRVPWALGFFQEISTAMPRDGILLLDSMVGLWLDRRLGWTPALTITGTVLGTVLSFLNVYWKLAAIERRHRKEREG